MVQRSGRQARHAQYIHSIASGQLSVRQTRNPCSTHTRKWTAGKQLKVQVVRAKTKKGSATGRDKHVFAGKGKWRGPPRPTDRLWRRRRAGVMESSKKYPRTSDVVVSYVVPVKGGRRYKYCSASLPAQPQAAKPRNRQTQRRRAREALYTKSCLTLFTRTLSPANLSSPPVPVPPPTNSC